MQVLTCALLAEAAPLIHHFSLKQQSNEQPFKIYSNGEIFLIITGIGKISAGAACSYFFAKHPYKNLSWLNLGVSGSLAPIGTPFLAHKITDKSREINYFPIFPFSLPCESCDLVTVERPQKEPEEKTLYDMEGAGFFEIVRRFSTLELIHCLKIVSDQGTHWLEKKVVSSLIENQILLIETVLSQLKHLSSKEKISEKNPLSATEACQLKRLLEKCEALNLEPPSRNPRELKQFLKKYVPTHLY